jgi:hypothetical protein
MSAAPKYLRALMLQPLELFHICFECICAEKELIGDIPPGLKWLKGNIFITNSHPALVVLQKTLNCQVVVFGKFVASCLNQLEFKEMDANLFLIKNDFKWGDWQMKLKEEKVGSLKIWRGDTFVFENEKEQLFFKIHFCLSSLKFSSEHIAFLRGNKMVCIKLGLGFGGNDIEMKSGFSLVENANEHHPIALVKKNLWQHS